jgi:hypothetical protein
MHWSFMMLKRLDLPAALMLALAAVAPVGAQSGGKFSLPNQAVRQGVEVRPPQTVVVADPYGYYRNPSYPMQPVPVQFTLVPAILMSDGSIFANFGFGYEPVIRSCNAVVVTGQVQRIGANGVVLTQSNALPYTQPVPNPITASQQMIASGHRLSGPAQLSCFTRDAAGRVFVYRRS